MPKALLAPVLVGLLACGGADMEAAQSERTPWAEMSHDERKRFMGQHVLPAMGDLFREYDAERFAAFSCDTCHGPDMQDRNYAMPNPSILPLYPTGHPEQLALVERERPMLTFMYQRVVPTMQEILGAQPYDEETGTGFSCFSCHPRAVTHEEPPPG